MGSAAGNPSAFAGAVAEWFSANECHATWQRQHLPPGLDEDAGVKWGWLFETVGNSDTIVSK